MKLPCHCSNPHTRWLNRVVVKAVLFFIKLTDCVHSPDTNSTMFRTTATLPLTLKQLLPSQREMILPSCLYFMYYMRTGTSGRVGTEKCGYRGLFVLSFPLLRESERCFSLRRLTSCWTAPQGRLTIRFIVLIWFSKGKHDPLSRAPTFLASSARWMSEWVLWTSCSDPYTVSVQNLSHNISVACLYIHSAQSTRLDWEVSSLQLRVS